MNNISEKIEAILFVSGTPLSIETLAIQFGISIDEISEEINKLKQKYSNDSGIHLIKFEDKIQFATNPDYAETIITVLNPIKEKALTKVTLETLAIIAYKQPITRLEIEQIRGVNCDYAVQTLLTHGLIDIVGRKDAVGKPLLLGTTENFLKRFDMESLNQLPKYEDLLDKIKVIHEQDSSLYDHFKVKEEERVTPELSQDEKVETVEP